MKDFMTYGKDIKNELKNTIKEFKEDSNDWY